MHELQTISQLWRYLLNCSVEIEYSFINYKLAKTQLKWKYISDSDITFPKEDIKEDKLFVPTRGTLEPKCAKGSTFCEQIDDYPAARVDLVLKENAHKYEELFGADMVIPDSQIVNRYNGIDEEEELCRSQERIIHPQAGLTQDNTWMYIVNQKNYTQGVRVEECL